MYILSDFYFGTFTLSYQYKINTFSLLAFLVTNEFNQIFSLKGLAPLSQAFVTVAVFYMTVIHPRDMLFERRSIDFLILII